MASTFSTAFIQIAFNVNKNQIIQELCENRFQPEIQCNGKCYLKKQIKQDTESKNGQDGKIVNETIHWLSLGINSFHYFIPKSVTLTIAYRSDLREGFLTSIEHPPPARLI